ncbi:general odorant-binding protein 71 [Neodiprion fabricii]|uniref:general odorant-binding protein 71 n=1 Tax=Neodiprion fabricii TaxID=2872261 RepID=UPI001ED8C3DC|nr:general odorant-binding protein 71 [Neodiprion fabricii]
MRFTQLLVFFVLVMCFHEGTALKCRTGEHRANDQFQKVMQRCKGRVLQGNRHAGDDSSDSSESESDSEDDYEDSASDSNEKGFDKKIMTNIHSVTSNTNPMKSSKPNNSENQRSGSSMHDQNSGSTRPYPYNKMGNNSYGAPGVMLNDKFLRNTTLPSGNSNSMAHFGRKNMRPNENNQACVIQCFFDELNLIDRKGFPEKSAVTKIMTQDIRDPELQDFIEEAVLDCFDMIQEEKFNEQCKFSQSLINCLASKGKEKCEDWDNMQ